MEDIPDHGDRRVVDAVDAGGAPRFEPGIVRNVVAKQTFVFGGHVGGAAKQRNIAHEGGWQAVGGVIGGAGSARTVKMDEDATLEGEDDAVGVHGKVEEVGRRRIASRCSIVCLEAVSVSVHFLNNGGDFHGEEQRVGALLCTGSDHHVNHIVVDAPGREPRRCTDVITQYFHRVVSGADVEDVVHLGKRRHVVG